MIENFKELRIGSGYLVSGQAIQAVIGFSANIVLVRFLLPEEFGRFALILSIAAIVLCIFSLNVRTLIVRTSNENYSEHQKDLFFSVATYETLFSSFVLIIWLFIFEELNGW